MEFAIIPKPFKIVEKEGFFDWNSKVSFLDKKFVNVDENLNQFTKKAISVEVGYSESADSKIEYVLNSSIAEEGYKLIIKPKLITISASAEVGFFYAVQTIKQLIAQFKCLTPCVEIDDAPRFKYRGYMLDVGRYYFTIEDIKKQIDYIALYKINVFHIHLTEDQGWRIEIDKYPELTAIGSHRIQTNLNCKKSSGFYTKAELKDLVSYCHARHIKVIPEMDMPGHFVSAIASYPYLSCFDREIPVACHWGVKHDIACAGKESTYTFIQDVLDEIIPIFTDGIFSLGGDEAVKTRWKICPHCQKAIKELGLKNEEELQSHFINRIAGYLKTKGIKSMMWNEGHPTQNLDLDIIWHYSDVGFSGDTIINEVKRGRKMVNICTEPYYLDLPYSINNLQRTYEYDPMLEGKITSQADQMLGVEFPLWTEYVPDQKQAELLTFPRLQAGAESAWTNAEQKNYLDFYKRLTTNNRILDILDVNYLPANRANPKGIKKFLLSKWWGRRMFHWEGLQNLVRNAKVARLANKNKK